MSVIQEHFKEELERCQTAILPHDEADQDSNSIGSRDSLTDSIPLLCTIYCRTHRDKQVFEVRDKALLTDGETLRLLQVPSLKKKFLELAQQCRSVLCYRVAPIQKVMFIEILNACEQCLLCCLAY